MFRYNPNANYQPNGGQYLQILLGKDLYKQTIVVSTGIPGIPFLRDFQIFLLIIHWDLCVGDKLWTNLNKAPLKLWQTQLNYEVLCTSSGVSSKHLNYTKRPLVRSVYRFHVYYHVR